MSVDSQKDDSSNTEAFLFPELLKLAFDLAIDGVIQNGMSGTIDEELTTGALLGAMAAHAPWCYAAWSDVEGAMPYAWTHYRKSGRDAASETYTGADFAIVLRTGPRTFRAAVFQAKRAKNKSDGFIAVQISPQIANLLPEPQLVRLMRYALAGQPLVGATGAVDWIHYLVYAEGVITHVPLNSMSPYCEQVVERTKQVSRMASQHLLLEGEPLNRDGIRALWKTFKLTYIPSPAAEEWKLLLGEGLFRPAGQSVAGWRELMGKSAAEAFIQETCPYADVYEGAPWANYKPILQSSDTIKVDQTILTTISKALFDNPGGSTWSRRPGR